MIKYRWEGTVLAYGSRTGNTVKCGFFTDLNEADAKQREALGRHHGYDEWQLASYTDGEFTSFLEDVPSVYVEETT